MAHRPALLIGNPSVPWERKAPKKASAATYAGFSSVSDYVLSRAFRDFTTAAEAEISTVTGAAIEDEVEITNMGQRTMEGPRGVLFSSIDALAKMGRTSPSALLLALLDWRARHVPKFIDDDVRHLLERSTTKGTTADAFELLEERLQSVCDWLFATCALRLLGAYPPSASPPALVVGDGLTEESVAPVANALYTTLRGAHARQLPKEHVNVARNRRSSLDLLARLLGLLSEAAFASCTVGILNDVSTLTKGDSKEIEAGTVVSAAQYIRVTTASGVLHSGSIRFLKAIAPHFIDSKAMEIKHAYCRMMHQSFKGFTVPPLVPSEEWRGLVVGFLDKCHHLATKPKHHQVAFPALASLLIAAPDSTFVARWWASAKLMLRAVKDESSRRVALVSLTRLCRCYFERHGAVNVAQAASYVDEIVEAVISQNKALSTDRASKVDVDILGGEGGSTLECYAALFSLLVEKSRETKVLIASVVLPLVTDRNAARRSAVGLGVCSAERGLDVLQKEPRVQRALTEAHAHWMPALLAAYGGSLLGPAGHVEEQSDGERSIMLELLKALLHAAPATLSLDGVKVKEQVSEIVKLVLHVDPEIRAAATEATERMFHCDRPEVKKFSLNEYSARVTLLPDSHGDLILHSLSRLASMLAEVDSVAVHRVKVEAAAAVHLCSSDVGTRLAALRVLEGSRRLSAAEEEGSDVHPLLDAIEAEGGPKALAKRAEERGQRSDALGTCERSDMPPSALEYSLGGLAQTLPQTLWSLLIGGVGEVMGKRCPCLAAAVWHSVAPRATASQPKIVHKVVAFGTETNLQVAREDARLPLWRAYVMMAAGVAESAGRSPSRPRAVLAGLLPHAASKLLGHRAVVCAAANIVGPRVVLDLLEVCEEAYREAGAPAEEEPPKRRGLFKSKSTTTTPLGGAVAAVHVGLEPRVKCALALSEVYVSIVDRPEGLAVGFGEAHVRALGKYLKSMLSLLDSPKLKKNLDVSVLRHNVAKTVALLYEQFYAPPTAANPTSTPQPQAPSVIATHRARVFLFEKDLTAALSVCMREWCGLQEDGQLDPVGQQRESVHVHKAVHDAGAWENKEHKREALLALLASVRMMAMRAVTAILKGPPENTCESLADSAVHRWIERLLQSPVDAVRTLGLRALGNTLASGVADKRPLVLAYINRSYDHTIPNDVSSAYFRAVALLESATADAVVAPADVPAVLVAALVRRADRSLAVRMVASRLLHALSEAHFPKVNAMHVGSYWSDIVGINDGAQLTACQHMADERPDLASSVLLEVLRRIDDEKDASVQSSMLHFLLPWLAATCTSAGEDESVNLLRRLLRVTLTFGHAHPRRLEAIWSSVARTVPIEDVMVFVLDVNNVRQNPIFIPVAKVIVSFLAGAASRDVCGALCRVLQMQVEGSGPSKFKRRLSRYASDATLTSVLSLCSPADKISTLSDYEFSLVLLSEIAAEHMHNLVLFVPALLHGAVIGLGNRNAVVSRHAKALLAAVLQAIVIAPATEVSPQYEDALCVLTQITEGDGPMWGDDDLDPTCAEYEVECYTLLSRLVKLTARALDDGEGNIQEGWAYEALKWASKCPAMHLTCRALQVLRSLAPPPAPSTVKLLLDRLIAQVEVQSADNTPVIAEILITLELLVNEGDALHGGSVGLYWAAVAVMATDSEYLFPLALKLYHALLRKTLFAEGAPAGEALLECLPSEDAPTGILTLLAKSLSSHRPSTVVLGTTILTDVAIQLATTSTVPRRLHDPQYHGPLGIVFLLLPLIAALERTRGLEGNTEEAQATVVSGALVALMTAVELPSSRDLAKSVSCFSSFTSVDLFLDAVGAPLCAMLQATGVAAAALDALVVLLEESSSSLHGAILGVLKVLIEHTPDLLAAGTPLCRTLFRLEDRSIRRASEHVEVENSQQSAQRYMHSMLLHAAQATGNVTIIVDKASLAVPSYSHRTWRPEPVTDPVLSLLQSVMVSSFQDLPGDIFETFSFTRILQRSISDHSNGRGLLEASGDGSSLADDGPAPTRHRSLNPHSSSALTALAVAALHQPQARPRSKSSLAFYDNSLPDNQEARGDARVVSRSRSLAFADTPGPVPSIEVDSPR